MPGAAFPIRCGDLLPVLQGTASYRDANNQLKPFNFTGWTDLVFTATGPWSVQSPYSLIGTLRTIGGAARGVANRLIYHWGMNDTALSGLFHGKFTGIDPEGLRQTFPTKGFLLIEIAPP